MFAFLAAFGPQVFISPMAPVSTQSQSFELLRQAAVAN